MNNRNEEIKHLEVSENFDECHNMLGIASDHHDEEYDSLGAGRGRQLVEHEEDHASSSPGGAPPRGSSFSCTLMKDISKGFTAVLLIVAIIWVLVDDYKLRYDKQSPNQAAEIPSTAAAAANIVIDPVSPSSGTERIPLPPENDNEDDNVVGDIDTEGYSARDKPSTPSFSLLPKRIYSVIGLEDSGTQFVSRLIRDALGIPQYREGSFSCRRSKGRSSCPEHAEVQVQHFSLPWGSTCQANPNPPVVDVVLPSQCTRLQTTNQERVECKEMVKNIWGFEKDDKQAIKYPARYQLDIVSHKAWYDAQSVEQFFVIVVRDQKISYVARTKHCSDPILKQEEEDVGTDIIVDAINTFILKNNNGNHHNVTRETYQYWAAQQYQNQYSEHKTRRKLSALPFGNNVAVVSYESLVKLGNTYIEMLYEVLGIDSNYFPEILNSNAKYVMDDTSNSVNHLN
mmetsp:Transcript_8113/g.15275  ORF Transcript_8113/g.15275 Transcript_8113/m.15275 type:complete len:455 (-) Transcript_8113:1075-2439(-)